MDSRTVLTQRSGAKAEGPGMGAGVSRVTIPNVEITLLTLSFSTISCLRLVQAICMSGRRQGRRSQLT